MRKLLLISASVLLLTGCVDDSRAYSEYKVSLKGDEWITQGKINGEWVKLCDMSVSILDTPKKALRHCKWSIAEGMDDYSRSIEKARVPSLLEEYKDFERVYE